MKRMEFDAIMAVVAEHVIAVILVVLCYISIGFAVVFTIASIEDHEIVDDDPFALVVMWPVFIVIYIVIICARTITRLLHTITCKFK